MNSRSAVVFLGLGFLTLSCVPSARIVSRPAKAGYFSNLCYDSAVEKYRRVVEEKFRQKDHSYVLSLLTYGITSFYAQNINEAKRAFMAAYRVDAGERPEAAKLYDWLVVDSRTVYKLKKRERELLHFYLGLCYLLENNLEEALVEFKKLRQFDQDASRLPIVNFYMGFVYERMGKYDDALIEYRGLEGMDGKGSGLVHNLELLRDRGYISSLDSVELVVQVDHQTIGSIGKTEVCLDSFRTIVTLPEISDIFDVKLTPAEANRKVAQEALAKATRLGLRLLGRWLLSEGKQGKGGQLADEIGDIFLGKEEENKDTRAWGYAPLHFSLARVKIPRSAEKVKLFFYNHAGELLGFCGYPLYGENRRAIFSAGTFFIIAGLAEEFYKY